MSDFSDAEKKLRDTISNKSFTWKGEKFTTGQAYKPEKKGSGGECKTDCYVLVTRDIDKQVQEIKISYKKENASFIENKIRKERAEIIFGKDWSNTIKKQITQIKKNLQDEFLFYLEDDRKTKKGSIKLGWRYEMEVNGTRPLGTAIEQDVGKCVWENKNGNKDYRNCPVNGKKIDNSGVPNYALIRNPEKIDSIEDIFPNLIPIADVIENGIITSAFTAHNYNPFRDYQGGGTNRHLSVPIDWSIKNNEITANLIFDKPLEFNSNTQLEKLKNVLKELDIPVGNGFNIKKFHKKLNPEVNVFLC